jgi:GT2 family glycosyltransferase
VIVVDSLVDDAARELYARYPTVTCIGLEEPIGPSAARRLITDASDSPFLLFLDDDNRVTPGVVAMLLGHLERHPTVGIAAGGWREDGSLGKRALGQAFHLGRTADSDIIFKSFLTIADAERAGAVSVRVDATLATMVVRRTVFESVGFDPRYDFFYELFDFFMQCREHGVVVEALPAAVFDHVPLPYERSTKRQASSEEADRRRFAEKWSLEPVGGTGFAIGGREGRAGRRRKGLLSRLASLAR